LSSLQGHHQTNLRHADQRTNALHQLQANQLSFNNDPLNFQNHEQIGMDQDHNEAVSFSEQKLPKQLLYQVEIQRLQSEINNLKQKKEALASSDISSSQLTSDKPMKASNHTSGMLWQVCYFQVRTFA
jgi:hypothetical protein